MDIALITPKRIGDWQTPEGTRGLPVSACDLDEVCGGPTREMARRDLPEGAGPEIGWPAEGTLVRTEIDGEYHYALVRDATCTCPRGVTIRPLGAHLSDCPAG